MKWWFGWSAVCIAASWNNEEVMRYLIDECKFDIHFRYKSPKNEDRISEMNVLHLVALDKWKIFDYKEEVQFDLLLTLINEYHVNESITTAGGEHVCVFFFLLFFLMIAIMIKINHLIINNQISFRNFFRYYSSVPWKEGELIHRFDVYRSSSSYVRWTLKFSALLYRRQYFNRYHVCRGDDDDDDDD